MCRARVLDHSSMWEKLGRVIRELVSQTYHQRRASHVALVEKNPPAHAGDVSNAGSIPGSGGSPGVGNGNPTSVFLPGKPHGQRAHWSPGTLAVTVGKVETGMAVLYVHRRSPAEVSLSSLLGKGHLDPRGGTRELFGVRAGHQGRRTDFPGSGGEW